MVPVAEPVRREAAVAAAATLSNVPNTSMLLEDMVVEGVSASADCGSKLDCGSALPSSALNPVGPDDTWETADIDEGRGAVECDVQEGPEGDTLIEEGRERVFVEDGSAVADSGFVVALGTSVVCTTPCTKTKVPGGGKLRGGTATGGEGIGIVGWTLGCVDSAGDSSTGMESSTIEAVRAGGGASCSCSTANSEVLDSPSL